LSAVTAEIRLKTGIPGLDPLIQGGLQKGDFILLLGDLGTGKTVFSSQFVYNSAKLYNETAVFATFEEDIKSLKRNMLRFGMDLGALEKEGKVKVLDLEALEGRGMGSNIEALLKALDDIGARRLVVDSLTAFMSGAEQKFDYSFLMHLIYKTLKREGVTTLMTVSRPQGSGVAPEMGVEEFVAARAANINVDVRAISTLLIQKTFEVQPPSQRAHTRNSQAIRHHRTRC